MANLKISYFEPWVGKNYESGLNGKIHHPSMGYEQEYWTKVLAEFFQKL